MSAVVTETIAVAELRVGMLVHLDLGWLDHPFPLSSFRITSDDQIQTIRGLGLTQVRWTPELSLPAGVTDPAPADAADAAGPAAEADTAPAGATASHAAVAAEPSPEQQGRAERRRRLAAERAGLSLCERQFAEAVRECRLATDLVPTRPQEAAAKALALSGALADKMLGEHDLCIRLLNETAGDRASMHAVNVAVVAMLMGRTFALGRQDMLDLGVGALLHDIGKLELPDRVRHRDEHFSPAEQRAYEEHVAHGVLLAKKMGLAPGATLVIAQHHEHADGSGFPLRLNTDRMTPLARVVALVNRYDNLCNPPLPGHALTPHEALSVLFTQAKSKYDTAILGAFIKMMGVYPPGSVVQLTDDRHAMVVAVNSSRPLKPRVIVHESGVPREEALVLDLERVPGLGVRRSLRPQALPDETRAYLAPRVRVAHFFEPVPDPDLAEAV